MSITNRIITYLRNRHINKTLQINGPLGDFYRNGGNDLITNNLPIDPNDLVIDAGGYIGEWTSKIIINYGSKSIIFEPVAEYFSKCNSIFGLNNRMILYNNGIGSSNELRRFYLSDVGTSEYSNDRTLPYVDVNTLDINEFINELINDKTIKATNGSIGCMKVNIEGGEYELLERLIETDKLRYFRCLLIQFHRNPSDWTDRKNAIVSKLELTHRNVWRFEMVWERWDIIS